MPIRCFLIGTAPPRAYSRCPLPASSLHDPSFLPICSTGCDSIRDSVLTHVLCLVLVRIPTYLIETGQKTCVFVCRYVCVMRTRVMPPYTLCSIHTACVVCVLASPVVDLYYPWHVCSSLARKEFVRLSWALSFFHCCRR